MNLFAVADHLGSLEWSAPSLDSKRCLYALDRYSACEACFGICPADAIQPGKPPTLNAERCVNCLACLTVCPAGAFTGDDVWPALLNAAARAEAQTIELVCELHSTTDNGSPEAGLAIRVKGCLAGVGPAADLALIALGKSKVIVRTDACAQCRLAALLPRIEAQLEDARQFLQAWGYKAVLVSEASAQALTKVTRPVWEADNPPLSRRDLFQLAARAGQTTLARTLAQDDVPHGSHFPPRQRRRLLKTLAHLPAGPEPGSQSGAVRSFTALSIAETCTACGACARACPTAALQFTSDDTQFQLSFVPQACIACDICAHVCAPTALTVQPSPALGTVFGQTPPVRLHQAALRQCPVCHARFAGRAGATICPVCEFRQKNPFGSYPVPGMRKVRA